MLCAAPAVGRPVEKPPANGLRAGVLLRAALNERFGPSSGVIFVFVFIITPCSAALTSSSSCSDRPG